MDADISRLIRGLTREGRMVEFVLDAVHEMSELDRARVLGLLTFFHERTTRTWQLASTKFRIIDLPDSTIERLINEGRFLRYWESYLKTGRRTTDYYADGSIRIEEVILDEAEYRGIFSRVQKIWCKLRDERASSRLVNKYISTGGNCKHQYELIHDVYVCIECRAKVTNAEIITRATRMLRGRLREFAC